MKLTKKLLATVLVVALSITAVPAMGATVDATNTVPNKKSLMKLVDEFSTPIGVTEEYIMKAGKTMTYNFSKVTARADMLRFMTEKKKEVNKYSKRMFGKKTSKVTLYPGEWGDSQVVMEIDSIKKTSKKNYYVKGQVYFSNLRDGKKHLVGTFRLYVTRNKKAKYKYVATKLKLTTWKKATTKSSKVNLFSSAKKYKNIKATMTYQLITVSGVDGAKAINKALKDDMNGFQKSRSATNFYTWVAEDDAKKIKDDYYFTATSKVKYNMNNILSIRITLKWYAGGAENTDEYGYNFDARTGKQIGIKKVVKGSTKTIKKKMYKAIDKKNWSKSYKKKAKKYIKKTSLKKLEFYMKNDKVIVCIEPYILGKKQRDFKSFYIFSIYF
ncbi:MAG: DUF4163 domain-containing protein [Eubacterium sp.]|nr:DUF4163 domain-containing protein [Eubacterium sp.]